MLVVPIKEIVFIVKQGCIITTYVHIYVQLDIGTSERVEMKWTLYTCTYTYVIFLHRSSLNL